MSAAPASALERGLRRLETAMAAFEEIDDARARAAAQALLEAVLDLHGLGLAKAIAIAQSGADGDAISQRLAADDHVSAILLLHGLHPEEADARLRKKIAAMRPHWGVCGFRVELLAVSAGEARARVRWSGDGDARADRGARLIEVEQALIDAAPDIDRIVLEQCETAGSTSTAPSRREAAS